MIGELDHAKEYLLADYGVGDVGTLRLAECVSKVVLHGQFLNLSDI